MEARVYLDSYLFIGLSTRVLALLYSVGAGASIEPSEPF